MKTRVDFPAPYSYAPMLLIAHVGSLSVPAEPIAQFHVIALWGTAAWVPWDVLVRLDPSQNPTFDWFDVTTVQLDAANELISDPILISHQCPYCNSRFNVPRHTRWGDPRGEPHFYGIPACAYDGFSDPLIWTPDVWPPAYL